MKRSAEETRHEILEGACRIYLSQGARHVTLENVAAEAGVSKGGLLYHFPSKEDLAVGMVEHRLQVFAADFHRALARESQHGEAGAWVRAYAQTTFGGDIKDDYIAAGILAAYALNPAYLDPVRLQYRRWQARFENNLLDPVLATLLRLVADGLWYSELLDLAPPDRRMRQKVLELLLALAGRDPPPPHAPPGADQERAPAAGTQLASLESHTDTGSG